jgi:multidrug efflux pump subunit AcrB
VITDIYETLQSTMGSLYVNDFNRAGRTYRVQLQSDAAFRMKPEDIGKVYVRSKAGQMVPLSALIRIEHVIGAEQLERFNGLLSAKLIGSGVAGLSSGEAIELVERIAARLSDRVDGQGVSGKAHRRCGCFCVQSGDNHGIPDSGGAV